MPTHHRFQVGMDLSLRSPAIAIHDQQLNTWQCVAFQQRRSDTVAQDGTLLVILPVIPTHTSDVERYSFIIEHVLRCITTALAGAPMADVHAILEGYAFKAKGTGSSFKLHELGGAMRYALHACGITAISTIYPAQWKQHTVGNGKGKQATVRYVHPIIDLETRFHCCLTGAKSVPNPIQDIADAIAITLGAMTLVIANKKRKIVP